MSDERTTPEDETEDVQGHHRGWPVDAGDEDDVQGHHHGKPVTTDDPFDHLRR